MISYHPGAFPIFSGTHAGLWDGCTTCHGSEGTWLPFSCFGCHKHNQTSMDQKHRAFAWSMTSTLENFPVPSINLDVNVLSPSLRVSDTEPVSSSHS